jgi:hypothetical protein
LIADRWKAAEAYYDASAQIGQAVPGQFGFKFLGVHYVLPIMWVIETGRIDD